MRPIDADALIEKCGGWYVDECTESGFIGTLENLLATEPTIQPQSTTGQPNDGVRSTARSTNLIDRQQTLDALIGAVKKVGILDADDIKAVFDMLPTIKPVATDICVGDTISRQALCEYALNQKDKSVTPNDIMRFPSVQPEPKWIPVERELPRDGSWNIFTDGKNISVERYKADAIDHFFPNGRWFQLEDVIAWMPLPTPYTK